MTEQQFNKSENEKVNDWRQDIGRPAYDLPLIVDTPKGKKDISDWAKDELRFDYWLALRAGDGGEINARVCVPRKILLTLEHGKNYKTKDICSFWLGEKAPENVTFIVEKL